MCYNYARIHHGRINLVPTLQKRIIQLNGLTITVGLITVAKRVHELYIHLLILLLILSSENNTQKNQAI